MTIWIIEMYKVVYRKCINIPLFPYKSCPFLDDPFHVIWMSKQMLCHGGKTHSQPSPKNVLMISSETFSFWTWNLMWFIIKWDTKRISTYRLKWKLLSCVWLSATPVLQARILEWVFPSPGDLSNPWMEPRSPALQADSLPAEPPGKPKNTGWSG